MTRRRAKRERSLHKLPLETPTQLKTELFMLTLILRPVVVHMYIIVQEEF